MARIGIMVTQDATSLNMEHVLFRIATVLSKEHQVDLVGAKKVSERIERSFFIYDTEVNLPIIFKILPGKALWARAAQLNAYTAEKSPDMLLAISGIGVNGLAVALVGRKKSIPSAVRVTSDIFEIFKTQFSIGEKIKMFVRNNLLGRISMALADKVVLLHESQITGLSKAGFNRKKFFVAPQPVDFPTVENPEKSRKETRSLLGIPDDAYVVGSALRLHSDKKIELMEGCIQEVLSKDESVYFVIAGDGDRRKWLESRLTSNRVKFIGELKRDELARFYVAFDKVIHMSGSEGLANVIIEALYFEKPVVATDSGPVTKAILGKVSDRRDELVAAIINRDMKAQDLPDSLSTKKNTSLWLSLIDETVG